MASYVYILASERNGTLYVGVTTGIRKRVFQHKKGEMDGFTKKHGVKMLVHFQVFDDVSTAIQREKNIKKWPRKWKLSLIEEHNPSWRDLYEELNK